MNTELKVDGMHCAGCAGSIERALKRVEGVRGVEVDRERKRAVIEHDDDLNPTALAALVNDIGFAATVMGKRR